MTRWTSCQAPPRGVLGGGVASLFWNKPWQMEGVRHSALSRFNDGTTAATIEFKGHKDRVPSSNIRSLITPEAIKQALSPLRMKLNEKVDKQIKDAAPELIAIQRFVGAVASQADTLGSSVNLVADFARNADATLEIHVHSKLHDVRKALAQELVLQSHSRGKKTSYTDSSQSQTFPEKLKSLRQTLRDAVDAITKALHGGTTMGPTPATVTDNQTVVLRKPRRMSWVAFEQATPAPEGANKAATHKVAAEGAPASNADAAPTKLRPADAVLEQLDGLRQSLASLAEVMDVPLPTLDELEQSAEKLLGALKGLVKDASRELNDAANDMKAEAVSELETLVKDAVSEEAGGAIEEACGALACPTIQLVRRAVHSRIAAEASQAWRVREVAALAVHRVLEALRRAEQSDDIEERREVMQLRTALQEALMRRRSLEPSAIVRVVLKDGAALACELNGAAEGDGSTDTDAEKAAWTSTDDSVKAELDARLAELARLQQEADAAPDVFTKQVLIVKSRDASAAIARASTNVKDIGSPLNVVVSFLGVIDKKLEVIDGKLDSLQNSVRAMHSDLKRLIGKPVLDVVCEHRCALLNSHRALREKVYIPLQGVAAGLDGKFVVDETIDKKGQVEHGAREPGVRSDGESERLPHESAAAGAAPRRAGWLGKVNLRA